MCLDTCESRRHYITIINYTHQNQHTNLRFLLEWQRLFQMVSHKYNNFDANEDFVMSLYSKLVTCFIDGLISGLKSRPIVYLSSESAYIYIYIGCWSALVMGIVDKHPLRMQGQLF